MNQKNPWKTRDFWGSKLHHKLSIVLRRIQGFLPKMATPRLQGQPAHVANEEDIQDIQCFQMYTYFLLGKNTRFPWLCRLQSLSHLPPRLKEYCTYDTNDLIQQLKHAHQDPLERWRVQNTNSLLLTSLLFSKVNGPDHRGWGLVANTGRRPSRFGSGSEHP